MKKSDYVKKTFALFLTLVCVSSTTHAATFAANDWTPSADTEIFIVSTADFSVSDESLTDQVKLFAAELNEKGKMSAVPAISYGAADKAGANDILLVLDSTLGIASQGYSITAGSSSVTVSASDADGLFYGCRNLIRQLVISGSVDDVSSSPAVAERALSLDCGRKYYTVDWIKQLIRELSWSDMNALVLHFSEEMGLGLESKTYPWLAGRDGKLCVLAEIDTDNRYLTQDELREIAEYAQLYHVKLIPSFDSPGHMNYIVKKFNEKSAEGAWSFTYNGNTHNVTQDTDISNYYHYNGQTAIVQGSRNTNYSRGIDISNEIAVAFTQSLVEEYATLFRELGCTAFDIGGDELLGFGTGTSLSSSVSKWKQLDHWKESAKKRSGNSNAVAYDAFMYYMNDLYELVSGLGYTSVRMWNDDALRSADTGWNGVVTLNKNIEILYWTPKANSSNNNVWTYLNANHKVYNYLNIYNYYVLGAGAYDKANQESIYTSWNPYVFDPDSSVPGGKNTAIGNSNVKGSAFCIWCDNPTAQEEASVMSNVLPMLRAHGAKSWDAQAEQTVAYSTFKSNIEKLGDAPASGPAVQDIYIVPDTSALEAAISEFSESDGSAYTDDTFAAYRSAVSAGQAVLASSKPTQAQVDAALANIQTAQEALKEKGALDYTALDAALKEFDDCDKTLYTDETYKAYSKAASDAQELKTNGASTQDEIDAAVALLETRKGQLREKSEVGTEEWMVSIASQSSSCLLGKTVTLSVGVKTSCGVTEFEVYDDLGNRVELSRVKFIDIDAKKPDKQFVYLMFKTTEKGQRTYTVYAVDSSSGKRSPDKLSCTIKVK
ncbi:MAG: family 20 glycosylhydrolase [Eubacteriales bacterium]